MKCVNKVEESVERRHGNVREGQVDDEVISHSPHASVSQNDPDDCDVPCDGHQDDEGVSYRPQSHLKEEETRGAEVVIMNKRWDADFNPRMGGKKTLFYK